MQKYNFKIPISEWTEAENIKVIEIKSVIKYKCLICQYEHEYDKNWTDEKKAEVQAEMDAHHAEHIIP